jgi:hypothetical protein
VNDCEESNCFFLRPAFRGHVKYSKLCLIKMSKNLDQNVVNGNRKDRHFTPPHEIYTTPFPLASRTILMIHTPSHTRQ